MSLFNLQLGQGNTLKIKRNKDGFMRCVIATNGVPKMKFHAWNVDTICTHMLCVNDYLDELSLDSEFIDYLYNVCC